MGIVFAHLRTDVVQLLQRGNKSYFDDIWSSLWLESGKLLGDLLVAHSGHSQEFCCVLLGDGGGND